MNFDHIIPSINVTYSTINRRTNTTQTLPAPRPRAARDPELNPVTTMTSNSRTLARICSGRPDGTRLRWLTRDDLRTCDACFICLNQFRVADPVPDISHSCLRNNRKSIHT